MQSCLDKQKYILNLFSQCPDSESKYQKIIELGKNLPRLDPRNKIPANMVNGCQSIMYLHAYLKQGLVFFETESDALISSGLAAILTTVYSGESPETILKSYPDYLEKLGLSASLTPSRANGLYSIHLKMKQDALRLYTLRQN